MGGKSTPEENELRNDKRGPRRSGELPAVFATVLSKYLFTGWMDD